MGPRPTHIDLHHSNHHGSAGSPLPTPKMNAQLDLPSPRTGEIPPALSPLDAFALHSRILAKRFEEEAQNGRRISRLPATAVAKELANRPDYFRHVTGSSEGAMSDVSEGKEDRAPSRPATSGGLTIARSEMDRPISHYPMFGDMLGGLGKTVSGYASAGGTPFVDAPETQQYRPANSYFGVAPRRASSPDPVSPRLVNVEAPSPAVPSLTNSVESLQSSQPRTATNGSTASQQSQRSDRGLVPPPSPRRPKSPRSMQSIRSVPQDNNDEQGSSYDSYAVSSSRKLSGSSNLSRPQSPFSPSLPVQRSASITSQYSLNSSQPMQQRTQFANFSRPMSGGSFGRQSFDTRPSTDSRGTRPSLEQSHRHLSAASSTCHSTLSSKSSRQNSLGDAQTPYAGEFTETPGPGTDAEHSNYFTSGGPDPPPSYTYVKYSLPRGRTVERNSGALRESWAQQQFTWEQEQEPPPASTTPADADLRTPDTSVFESHQRPASPARSDKISGMQLSSSRPRGTSRSRSTEPAERVKPPLHRSSPSTATESTDRTLRPAIPLHQRAPSAELTPEEHLDLGIESHSAGHLQKSTYHLRLAAKAGLPTGMLLYALACRHGWGMRPNPEDGVMWLRKAIESSGLEMSGIDGAAALSPKQQQQQQQEQASHGNSAASAAERKKRKAQFALAIYELGISYMNGWGCAKDRALAVKCYEVAGSWGDCDALAEAGFCYTQGVGVKKDLKRAAALYRKAAEGGMSMAGNSWIFKAKYMDAEPESPATAAKEKPTSSIPADAGKEKPVRSRGRSLWGRSRKDKAAS